MIERDLQLRIQAFLDGELNESQARDVAALIAADREAAALHAELKHTRQALAGAEAGIKVPETREFYWSKIAREIEKTERIVAADAGLSPWQLILRLLKPVAAVAAVVLAGYAAFTLSGPKRPVGGSPVEVLVASADVDAITYYDYADDTTFVWFSYPGENGVANDGSETTFN